MNNDLAAFFEGEHFDPSTVEPQGDFQAIPPCKPACLIEEAEVKQTKDGTGHYVKLTLKILEGQYANRKLFDQINIQNPSAQCVEIGLRTLSALGRALSLSAITDTAQLVNQVVIPHVKVKSDPKWGDQNVIHTYSAPEPVQPSAPPPVTQVQPGPAVTGDTAPITTPTASPPWAQEKRCF